MSEENVEIVRQHSPLFLPITDTATVTVVLEPEKSGTLVRVAGVGEPKVSQAFDSMVL
jgi:hypothetical protein